MEVSLTCTWGRSGALREGLLCHLMFGDIVHYLEVTEDVCDLLVDHISAFLLVFRECVCQFC